MTPEPTGPDHVLSHLASGTDDWPTLLNRADYLHCAPGTNTMQALIARAGNRHLMALPWRIFGDNGHATRPGDALHTFAAGEAAPGPATVKVTPPCRRRAFASASDQNPAMPVICRPLVVNTAGKPLSPAPLDRTPVSRFLPLDDALRGGTVITHSAVGSPDTFLPKAARRRGMGQPSDTDSLGSAWRSRANRDDTQGRSIVHQWPKVVAGPARRRARAGVTAAIATGVDWSQAAAALRLTPANLLRWTKGLAA